MRESVVMCLFRFGEFELDVDRYELRRNGFPVKIENLPLQLLMMLLRRRGCLVTRQELHHELWGAEVFLDVEQGINTAIRKIRRILRDRPERPRFLQTIVGKGYRFIAVEVSEVDAGSVSPAPPVANRSVTSEELGQAILAAAGLDGSTS